MPALPIVDLPLFSGLPDSLLRHLEHHLALLFVLGLDAVRRAQNGIS